MVYFKKKVVAIDSVDMPRLVCSLLMNIKLIPFKFQDRLTFRRIVLKNAYNKRKMFETLLENVPMLKTLNVSTVIKVANHVVCLMGFTDLTNQ